MSVTAPNEVSEASPAHLDALRLNAWALCAEFVEQMVSEARATATGQAHDVPEVDWAPIWRAGEGAPSDEAAIGRIVRVTSETVRRIAPHEPNGHREGPHANGLTSATVPGSAALRSPPPVTDHPGLVSEPVIAPAAAPTVPLSAPPAPPSTGPGSAQGPAALMTEAVVMVPSVAPITEPEPEPPAIAQAITQVEAERTREVPIVAAPLGEDATGSPRTEAQSEAERALGESRAGHSGWFHVFTWVRNVGLIILLFVVWQLWGTAIAQHQAQNQLKSQFDAALHAHHGAKGSKSTLIPASTFVSSPGDGAVVAEIQIPAIGVDQYVVEGTTSDDLSKGPGHYVGTAMPGQAGNVGIAGHRTTHGAPFNRLGQLVTGDQIILTSTMGQRLTYVVSGPPQVVSPSDVSVLSYFGDNRITLTTCNPEFSSSQRLVVVGELKGPFAAPASTAHISYHVANSVTAGWDWSLLPLVGIEVCLLLLLALSYGRMRNWFGGVEKWFILVPLWAAGLYLLFNTLTNFLPASI